MRVRRLPFSCRRSIPALPFHYLVLSCVSFSLRLIFASRTAWILSYCFSISEYFFQSSLLSEPFVVIEAVVLIFSPYARHFLCKVTAISLYGKYQSLTPYSRIIFQEAFLIFSKMGIPENLCCNSLLLETR